MSKRSWRDEDKLKRKLRQQGGLKCNVTDNAVRRKNNDNRTKILAQIRKKINKMVAEGKSDEEIKSMIQLAQKRFEEACRVERDLYDERSIQNIINHARKTQKQEHEIEIDL